MHAPPSMQPRGTSATAGQLAAFRSARRKQCADAELQPRPLLNGYCCSNEATAGLAGGVADAVAVGVAVAVAVGVAVAVAVAVGVTDAVAVGASTGAAWSLVPHATIGSPIASR